MGSVDDELISCMKEDMENAISDVMAFYNEKFENISNKIKKRYELM